MGLRPLSESRIPSRGLNIMRLPAKLPLSITSVPKASIPVPRVYGYSSSEGDPVGAEYIVMEKAPGVGLETRWLSMSKRERHKLASSFVEIETKFIDIPFRSVGSIYFKRDVPSGFQAPLHATGAQKDHDMSRFALAPLRIICFGMGKELVSISTVGPVCFLYFNFLAPRF